MLLRLGSLIKVSNGRLKVLSKWLIFYLELCRREEGSPSLDPEEDGLTQLSLPSELIPRRTFDLNQNGFLHFLRRFPEK